MSDLFLSGGVFFGIKMTTKEFLEKQGVAVGDEDLSVELSNKVKYIKNDLKSFGSDFFIEELGVDAEFVKDDNSNIPRLECTTIFIGIKLCDYSQRNQFDIKIERFEMPNPEYIKSVEKKLSRLFSNKPSFYSWTSI